MPSNVSTILKDAYTLRNKIIKVQFLYKGKQAGY